MRHYKATKAFMGTLNWLEMNDHLSAKICHLDCLFRTTVHTTIAW